MKKYFLILLFIVNSAFANFGTADLKHLIAQSKLKDSDVLMVWKDGELLHSSNTDKTKQYSIQSVTKSLTALTTSCIFRDHPEKLDEPRLFKEWEGTAKSAITLRMLLTMSSGIVDPADPWGKNDYYRHAASLPLTYTPGKKFAYANTSTMLIGKWIKENTGHQFSHHINRCMFEAMGITEWRIGKDGQKNEVVAGGVRILAKDLLKVGIMLAQDGVYEGQQLYTSEQISALRKGFTTNYGLGFWVWGKNTYYAEGYLGQFLIIVPSEKLVVLRLRNRSEMRSTVDNKSNWFHELPGLVSKLISK
ncbi:MAG TPA: serine hydrolase domain-containing protein [Bacteriovoracaceae bacterium]|nr:serine hydrolase domain-containing protein [Bacteriovoracaceae bacterium]